MVFSRAWFRRHQRTLLAVLALPVIGRELRDVLAIRRCDVGYDRPVVALYRHAYTVAPDPDGTFTTDVRTSAKYAKRLRHQLAPLWRAAHRVGPRRRESAGACLNLGFDTFTIYPDPDPEVTTVDGIVGIETDNQPWASVIAGAGTNAVAVATADRVCRFDAGTASAWFRLWRSFFLFDTSVLGAGDLSAAVLSLYGYDKYDQNAAGLDVDIYTSNPASNTALANADFTAVGSVSQTGAPIGVSAWSISAYNAFTLNATGRSNIDTTGISKFGGRNSNYDVAATTPPRGGNVFASGIDAYYADQTGSANDPKLVVTFTPLTLPQFGLFDPA